jgi:hypothetical protein
VDETLIESLREVLAHGAPPEDPALVHGYEDDLCLEHLSRDDFIGRVQSVDGWDSLVVYQSYVSGMDWSRLEPVQSLWLRWRLSRGVMGPPQDGYFRVLIVRDDAVVGSLVLHGPRLAHGVMKRAP